MKTRVALIADAAAARAPLLDSSCAFPSDDIAELHRLGLLHAPFSAEAGGVDLGSSPSDPLLLMEVLSAIGAASLPLGRLFEGHVNAVKLVRLYGSPAAVDLLAREADAGRISGVWMAEADRPLRLDGGHLSGTKVLCSGAGHIRRPLVAALGADGSQMVLPCVGDGERVDLAGWVVRGMRATATGTVDFDGIPIAPHELVGRPGDYLRSPYFRGGAWRVLAVQLGGIEAIMSAYRTQLRSAGRDDDRVQQQRFAQALRAAETARLWVREAALRAEDEARAPADVDAYVDLARGAFTDAALVVIDHAERAIGLRAFLQGNPIERLARDLSTYLRQPALDASSEAAAAHASGAAS